MVRKFSILFVLLVLLSGTTVYAIHSELQQYVSNARQYEKNVIEHMNGNYWNMTGGFELGDTSEMTQEEVDALMELYDSASGDEPLGSVSDYEFKYFYDVNGVFLYQFVNIDGKIVITRWDGTTPLDITERDIR